MISARARAPGLDVPLRTVKRAPLTRTSLHNSEIRKVTPGFMGTLLVYEK
jgi:hypothetical protein